MITAYLSPTANCRRVSVMLSCCALPFTVQPIDRMVGEQKTPEFLRLNPAGAVPVIADAEDESNPVVMAQSGAILLYLAAKSGRFHPQSGAARRDVDTAFMQVLTDVNPAASMFLLMNKSVDANDAAREFCRARLVKFLRDCNRRVSGSNYLAGDMSIADIALYPVCESRRDVIDADPELEPLRTWIKRMADDSAVASGMAAI